jgi:hypothetical protein
MAKRKKHQASVRLWVSIGNDGVSVEVPTETCLDQAKRFWLLKACTYISLSDAGPWSSWAYHRGLDLSERAKVAGLAPRDLCPLCGEDREHPSQHGRHACNRQGAT